MPTLEEIRTRFQADRFASELTGAVIREAEPGQTPPPFLSNCIRVLLGKPGTEDFQTIQDELFRGLGIRVQEVATLAAFPTAPYLAARERYGERFAGREYFMENLMVALFLEPDP